MLKVYLVLAAYFFFIQIGVLILFQTSNIIITKVIGPEAVTEFNIAFKLFSIVSMLFTIIITPYWSAFTEAYAKKDFLWIKKTLTKVRLIWIGFSLILVPLLLLSSDFLFKIWIGSDVRIPKSLSISMAFYAIGFTGLNLNCYFLNGIGKLRLQLVLYLVVCLINVPLSIYLGKLYGTTGVAISSVIILFFNDFNTVGSKF